MKLEGSETIRPPEVSPAPLLIATGVEKTFERTRALAGAELDIYPGEVMGLLGANGAGKSTLSKVISGHVIRDAGSIIFGDKPLNLRSAREAIHQGITMVMQETSLAPDLSVLENVFLADLGSPGFLSYNRLKRKAEEILDRLGQKETLPLNREVRLLSAAQRQLVEIAKALALNSTLIIFDEPTASLSPPEVERLFQVMMTLKRSGHTLVFVSHRLEEVFAITDRVTVMREGRTVAKSLETASLSQAELIRLMVGQELKPVLMQHSNGNGAQSTRSVILEVRNLASPPAVRDVSFKVHRGEILGLGGLIGAGRSETVETIFGLRARQNGELHLNGKPFAPKRASDAIRAGIGFVAEDRRVQGIVPDFSVRENLLLGHLAASRKFGLGYSDRKQRLEALLQQFGLPAKRLDTSLLNFSGGMQQKIIMARWLLLDSSLLLLDEPTKGVDIGTRTSIYEMLRQVADRGAGIVVISSDFEELLHICERIVVISDGVSIADVPSATLNEEKLTLFAAPRTSMEQNSAFLRDIARDLNGAAFWTLIDQERLFCLYTVVENQHADPGFRTADTPTINATRIPAALNAKSDEFVIEVEHSLASLLISIQSSRGHDMGWIGVTLNAQSPRPPARQIRERIELLVNRLTKSQYESMNSNDPPGSRNRTDLKSKSTVHGSDRIGLASEARSKDGERSLVGELVGRLEVRMLGLALLLGVVLTILSPHFLTSNNLLNVLDQSVVVGIVAIGMTFVILIGGIDLSVGSVAGCTGVLLGRGLEHLPIPVAVILAILAGCGIGLFSGVLIARFGLPAFVVTLGVMAIGRSLAYIFSGATAIADLPESFSNIVYTNIFGIPAHVITLLILYTLAWCYLNYTKGGRTIYAIGSNREAARTAGLNVLGFSILPYIISGGLSAVAITFASAQVMSIDPVAGTGLELDAIAAVVIGGASLYGGRGSIVGTLIGVLIMVMIRNGLNLLNVSPFWQGSAIGAVIITAVLIERLLSTRST